MSEQAFIDDGDPKRYFAQIPNIVLKLGLSPYALALYMHIKQTAAEDGRCTKNTATLARETGMGAASISRAKAELAKPFPLLNNKPLIQIDEQITNAPKPKHLISIVDIWPENMSHFAQAYSNREQSKAKHYSHMEQDYSNREQHCSNREIKKNTTQEEPKKKKPTPNGVGADAAAPDAVKMYRSIRGYSPNQTQRKEILATVTDLPRWQNVLETMERQGQQKHRVDWALERYGGDTARGRPRLVDRQEWDGDSQLDVPGYAWKPKPMSFEEKIRELMEITGWTREAAITELELKGHGPNGRTAAAA